MHVLFWPYHLFKNYVSSITSQALSPFYGFNGDTVYMTLFFVLILARLLQSWPFHPPLGAHVCQLSKHSLSVIFSVKRLRVFPQDWRFYSANQFPLPSAQCPSVHVPLWSQVTESNIGGQQVCDKTEVVWWCWLTTGDAGSPDVHLSRDGSGRTEWQELYNTKANTQAETSVWPISDSWMPLIRDSWETPLSHCRAHLSVSISSQLVSYFLSFLFYIEA